MSATTNFGGSDLFYPFTSSTDFDPEHSYSKFAVYATLAHRGDFKRAALTLAENGFGASDAKSPIAAIAHTGTATAVTTADQVPARALHLTPASQITVRPVRWLWTDRLPLGTLGLLGGREGVGKTICVYTLGAAITRGTLMLNSCGGAYWQA